MYRIRWQLQPDDLGWIIVIGAITIVEFRLPRDRMLSHSFARFKKRHPVLAFGIVLVTGAHLLELTAPRYDLFHIVIGLLRPPPPHHNPRHD